MAPQSPPLLETCVANPAHVRPLQDVFEVVSLQVLPYAERLVAHLALMSDDVVSVPVSFEILLVFESRITHPTYVDYLVFVTELMLSEALLLRENLIANIAGIGGIRVVDFLVLFQAFLQLETLIADFANERLSPTVNFFML